MAEKKTTKNEATKKPGHDFANLVKIKKLLLEYANEKAEQGEKKVANNVRFAVAEMENPKIIEIVKIVLEDGITPAEGFALCMLTMFASICD